MLSHKNMYVWIGILILSGMFLMGQEPWQPVCVDLDLDGYGNPPVPSCTYPETDCFNDVANGANVYPGAPEICDGMDNQCPGDTGYGEIDEGCASQDLIVFVTSTGTNGDLGGYQGAVARCNSLANAAGLPGAGSYLPWISISDTNCPEVRFNKNASWKLVTGEPVAWSWADLTTNNWDTPNPNDFLRNAIQVDENGNIQTSTNVWSATTTDGEYDSNYGNCEGWNSASGNDYGMYGDVEETDMEWTLIQSSVSQCDFQLSIYCFQQ